MGVNESGDKARGIWESIVGLRLILLKINRLLIIKKRLFQYESRYDINTVRCLFSDGAQRSSQDI